MNVSLRLLGDLTRTKKAEVSGGPHIEASSRR